MLTVQQVYNKIRKHLLTQNKTALYDPGDGHVICAYRGDDGTMCAVGCLIEDKHYIPEMEGKCIEDKNVFLALKNSGVDTVGNDDIYVLIDAAQGIHDNRNPEDWKYELDALAEDFSLEVQEEAN